MFLHGADVVLHKSHEIVLLFHGLRLRRVVKVGVPLKGLPAQGCALWRSCSSLKDEL